MTGRLMLNGCYWGVVCVDHLLHWSHMSILSHGQNSASMFEYKVTVLLAVCRLHIFIAMFYLYLA